MWYNQVVIDDDWIVGFAHNLEQFSCQELWIKNLAKTFFQNDYPLIIFYLFARVVHSWKYYSLERNIPWANEGFICHLLFSLHFSLFSFVHRQSFPLCIKLFLFVFMCFLSFYLKTLSVLNFANILRRTMKCINDITIIFSRFDPLTFT